MRWERFTTELAFTIRQLMGEHLEELYCILKKHGTV
jgi:hypothetical protein